MMRYTATYSPEDNKLRLYASSRLDAETYERVRAAGFRWAPKQGLFVAPAWCPSREDLLVELAGEIDDEDTTLVERAEAKADRLENLAERKGQEAEAAKAAVDRIAEHIPFGQPILVGHHSEKHARRDAKKIENGMRKAVNCWEAVGYWQDRAAGAVRNAKYKELPAVRARRIKKLEAELRKIERDKKDGAAKLALWTKVQAETDTELQKAVAIRVANHCWLTMPKKEGDTDRLDTGPTASGALTADHPTLYVPRTVEEVVAYAIQVYGRARPITDRWVAHLNNRLAYEKAMLDEAGAGDLLKPKPRPKQPPLLNYRAEGGTITGPNIYDRNRPTVYRQVDMTKAEYGKVYNKFTRPGPGTPHRIRCAYIGRELLCVFLTDQKEHPPQTGEAPAPAVPEKEQAPAVKPAPARETVPDQAACAFGAMKAALKQGVQVVVANQLFPTPAELARKMVAMAGIKDGDDVLEPSAGTGKLMEAIAEVAGTVIFAVEKNDRLALALMNDWPDANVWSHDFLDLAPEVIGGQVDAVVMNPPFERGADIAHIIHAKHFLKPGGRLVAICANGPRQRAELMDEAEHWEDLPEGTFAPATNVRTALLVIRK